MLYLKIFIQEKGNEKRRKDKKEKRHKEKREKSKKSRNREKESETDREDEIKTKTKILFGKVRFSDEVEVVEYSSPNAEGNNFKKKKKWILCFPGKIIYIC